MFTSALSLLSAKRYVDSTPENSMLPCCDVQNVVTIDVVAFRLSPLDTEDEDSMIQFARFGYHLYLSGLFVYMISSCSLIVWAPLCMEQNIIKQLGEKFEVMFISVHQCMHWLRSALARSMTLQNSCVTALDSGVVINGYVTEFNLTVSGELNNGKEAQITISLRSRQERWNACCLTSLDLELGDPVYIAPSLSMVSPSYVVEESTQDENSEHWYLGACLSWGYRLCEVLLKVAYMSNDGEVVVSRIFPQMILKRIAESPSAQTTQRNMSESDTVMQLLNTCIAQWSCFSMTLLDTIDVNKCLLLNKTKRTLFKFVQVESSSLQKASSRTPLTPRARPFREESSRSASLAPKETLSERYEKVIKALTEQSSLNTKMRGMLDEIRRDLEYKDTSIPEPVNMKPVKTSRRQISSKLVATLSPPDIPRKASRRTPKKLKKAKESSASPVITSLPKKSDRRVHFNTTVLFVDEWDKVHRIKLQQHEAVSYHQEDDLQQDIESEFTASLLS